jgi:hypothetical protein
LTGAVIEIPDLVRWINEGQIQILRQTTTLLGSQSIPVVAGDGQYDLATDFFRMQSVELDGVKLQILTLAQMSAMYPTLNASQPPTGSPRYFAVGSVGTSVTQLFLAPKPAAAGTLSITYKARPPLINASADALSIPDEYFETLVMYCLAKAKQLDGDDEGWAATQAAVKEQLTEDGHDSKNERDDETYPYIRVSAADNVNGWYC